MSNGTERSGRHRRQTRRRRLELRAAAFVFNEYLWVSVLAFVFYRPLLDVVLISAIARRV